VAHGRKAEGQLLLVVGHIGGLCGDLGEEDGIALGVEVAEGGDAVGELVAEDESEGGHVGEMRGAVWLVRKKVWLRVESL